MIVHTADHWVYRRRLQPALVLAAFVLSVAQLAVSAEDQDRNEGEVLGVLAPGVPVEGEIAGGQSHTYQFTLKAGEYAQVVLDQRGVDLVLTLFGPDGERLAETDGPNGTQGPEQLALIAETPGIYRVTVHPYRDTASTGRYQIAIGDVRAAVPADETRIRAQSLLMECQQLWAEGGADPLRRAILKCEGALPLWLTSGNRQGEADTLYYLVSASGSLNEYDQALAFGEKLLALRQALADRRGEAVTVHNIGSIHFDVGQFQKALEYYLRALNMARQLENFEELGTFLESAGTTYSKLGEKQQALRHYEEGLAFGRAYSLPDMEAIMLYNIGTVHHSQGEQRRALSYYGQVLPFWQTLKAKRMEVNTLSAAGAAYVSLNETEKGIQHLQRALLLSREVGYRLGESAALSRLGEAYLSLADTEKAFGAFDQALSVQHAIRDREFEIIARSGIARAEVARGNLAAARQHLEAALEIVESVRSNVAQQGLRVAYLASKEEYYKQHIDVLMRLHAGTPSAGYDKLAFQASERARARALLEILAEGGANLREGVETTLLAREQKLQRELNSKAKLLTGLLAGRDSEEQASIAKKEMDVLLADYRQVQAEIRTQSPRYAALTQPQPLTVEEIQKEVLDPDSLLLEYLMGEERSFLWALTPMSLTSYVLPPRAELEPQARRVYDLLTARNRRPGETPGQRTERLAQAEAEYLRATGILSGSLLGPVAALLPGKRLIIVSEGALQYIPFGVLPTPGGAESGSGRDNNEQSKEEAVPLIAEHEVVNLPSASVLAVLRRELKGRPRAPKEVAVLADPVFRADDPRLKLRQPRMNPESGGVQPVAAAGQGQGNLGLDVTRSAEESGVSDFRRLRFSRQEADAIAALVPAQKSLRAVDFEASRVTATSPDLGRYGVVHIATHGLLNNRHPELSGVVLSLVDEAGRPQDGFMRLHEIYNLRLGADLVVLSACQTALGSQFKGEGLVGLTRGFMYAGAPRVMASLWSVDDRATAELMKRFYERLLRDQERPAAALRAAQVSMWKEKRWRPPYFWAGFAMQGEWK
ncbi:MAG: CHAT domain-containing protein [Acidobacteriota bacterium]